MKPWEKYQSGPWEKYQPPQLVGTSPLGAQLPLQPEAPAIPEVIAPEVRQTPASSNPLQAAMASTAGEVLRLGRGAQVLGNMAIGDMPAARTRREQLERIQQEQAERSEDFPVSSFAGGMAPYMLLPQATVSTVPRAMATGGALGALAGGGDPLQTGFGAGGGAAGVIAARAITQPFQASQPAQMLMRENVQPTVGQGIEQNLMGRAVRRGEEALQSMPLLGDIITHSRARAVDEFSEAAANRAMPFGAKLPKDTPVRDALNIIRSESQKGYDRVLKGREFDMSPGDIRGFQMALDDPRILVPPEARASVLADLTQLLQLGRTGQRSFDAQAVKQAQSQLRGIARQYGKSQTPTERQIGRLYERADQQLSKWMRRNLPDDLKAELKELDRAFANEIRVERAAAALGADAGQFTPAQLQSAVKATSGGARKGEFARGGALMQDLSEAGKTVLSGRLGESGTTPRALYNLGAAGALTGGAILEPTTALTAASLPLAWAGGTRPVQRWMLGGVSPLQQRAAQLITPTFGRAGVGMGQQ